MITYDHIASFDADPREGIRSRLAGKSFVYAGFKLIGALGRCRLFETQGRLHELFDE